jgi:hypothetical protein
VYAVLFPTFDQKRCAVVLTSATIDWVFVSGSAILSISIGLNAVSNHATCTAVFVAVAAVATFVLSSIPTLSKMSWLAAAGAISILVSSKYQPIDSLPTPNNQLKPEQS